MARLSLWAVLIGLALAVYLVVGWSLGKLSAFLDQLNALSGVFVAFFALVVILIERERDVRAATEATQQRERIDHEVSAVAFLIARQLRGWQQEVKMHSTVGDLAGVLSVLGEVAAGAPGRTTEELYRRIVFPLLDWWKKKTRDQNEAERRFERLVSIAPQASPAVGGALRRSFAKFYDFAGRWNHQVLVRDRAENPDWREVVAGLKSLDTATECLDSVIDPELRSIRDEVTPLVSPIEDLASALAAVFEKSDPQR